jgi:lambda family phage portal protein
VRQTLRNRARYEVANNSYARGMVLTLANDTVGTGPRLQMLGEDGEANRVVEQTFADWSKQIGLAEKLRTMRMARVHDGEAFALFVTNNRLPAVTLDLRLIEADQVATPAMSDLLRNLDREVDGISFDEDGNPVSYSILKYHPGEGGYGLGVEANVEEAANVIHWFRADRPGQARAVPEITPALPLFALLRDFSLATVDAAKTSAAITAVIKTMADANSEVDVTAPFDEIEIPRNLMMTLPDGCDITQFKSEHPNSTYADFVDKILNEIARCLNMPFNVAAGNSSKHNYASGRMDHQVYFKSIQIDQASCEQVVLDRIFARWLDEALLLPNYLPSLGMVDVSHQWFWDGREHVDPLKEANAQTARLDSHTTTLADEYARRGLDWETQLRQRAKEIALIKELGLPMSNQQPAEDEEEFADAA